MSDPSSISRTGSGTNTTLHTSIIVFEATQQIRTLCTHFHFDFINGGRMRERKESERKRKKGK